MKTIIKSIGEYLHNKLIGNFVGWFIGVCFIATSTYINGDAGWTDNNIVILIGLFIGCLSTTYLHAYWEGYRIEVDKKPIDDHNWRGFIVILISYLIGIIIHIYGTGIHAIILIQSLVTGAYCASIYYFFFDAFLNKYRKKPLLYISHSSNAANVDQQIAKLPDNIEPYAVLALKALLLAAATFAEFKMFSNL